jgi:uncharacterized membrane-anchored protein YjiN (DUF445 family)
MLAEDMRAVRPRNIEPAPRTNHVGTISLVVAVTGAIASRVAMTVGPLAGEPWLAIVAAGFEAATVGGLADWFAVTALFRRPLGLPIPHTAILIERKGKIIDGIVSMVEKDWLSPDVIGARLERIAPSAAVLGLLRDPGYVQRLGAPLRDLLRGLARTLREEEVAEFANRTLSRELRAVRIDATMGAWLARAIESEGAGSTFAALATSLANLAARPRTAAQLHWWLDRSAATLRAGGKRFVPFVLRRKVVQRAIVEAACDYAAAELLSAARDGTHPFRRAVLGALGRFAARLAAGDPTAIAQAEALRTAVVESLEAGPLLHDLLTRLSHQLEQDLADPDSALAHLVDRRLRAAALELLDDPVRSAAFDRWVRTTADELLRKYHHEIGNTVRQNLENLQPEALIQRIEDRVGADLQFIRLNGAVVGGLVGIVLALIHWLAG